jgi:hypothetical protein
MTAITHTFNLTSTRARRHEAHVLWRGVGLALAALSIVLAATLLEPRGTSALQTNNGWAGIEDRQVPGGWEDGVPLDVIPLGVLPPETSR